MKDNINHESIVITSNYSNLSFHMIYFNINLAAIFIGWTELILFIRY